MTEKRTLVLNTAANVAAQVVTVAVSFVTLPLMLRSFGTSVYGVFMIASSLVGFATLFDLGVGITTVKRIAEHLEQEDEAQMASSVSSALVLYGILGLLITAGIFLCGVYSDQLFQVSLVEARLLRAMLWILAMSQLVVWPCGVARHILAGHQRFELVAKVSMLSSLASAGAIVFVLLSGEGPLALVVANVAISISASLVLVIMAFRVLPNGFKLELPHWSILKGVMSISLPIFTVQMAAFFMRQQVDRLVLGVFLGASAVAMYEVAAKLGSLVSQLNDLAVSALLPYASRLNAKNNLHKIQTTFLYGSRYMVMVVIPLITVLVVWAPAIISIWCGEKFVTSSVAAQLLIASQMMLTTYMVADALLISKDRFKRWVPYAIALAGINLILSIVLVKLWGLTGVAFGTFVACIIEAPLYMRVVIQELEISAMDWVRSTLVPACVSFAFVFAVSVGGMYLSQATTFFTLIVELSVTLVLSYLFVMFVVMSRNERVMIKELLERVLAKVNSGGRLGSR